MSIRTWLRFLIGDRQAILDIAASRQAIHIGFLFVLSAAFAREYDQEDLWHDPEYLLIPFGVSLLASLILFTVTFGVLRVKRIQTPAFFVAYPMFLGLFWMTAPLAWLYAIPYERFLPSLEATRANLWTLGIVSLWRVGLMIRVVSVLMNYPLTGAAGLVMLVADVEALIGLVFLPWPLIDMMGGLMMSENEDLKRSTATLAIMVGFYTLLIWIVWAVRALNRQDLAWKGPYYQQARSMTAGGLSKLAAASVLIWTVVLPFSQPPVIRMSKVERLLKDERIEEALAEMSHHDRSAFPPMWDPPPHHFEQKPAISSVIVALPSTQTAEWVVDAYVLKLKRLRAHQLLYRDDAELKLVIGALKVLPGGDKVIEKWTTDHVFGDAVKKRLDELDAPSENKKPTD